MRTHIDWLTFTMTPRYQSTYPEGVGRDEQYASAIYQAFVKTFGKELAADAFGGNWEKNERSRAPYTDAWKLSDRGITLYASQALTHCCVEISGTGCESLITKDLLHKVLQQIYHRATRIDIASDIETDCKPSDFVAQSSHERMRASGYQKSETGETCYVGSQKSDRYARVYRYNEPHPRAHLLRIETVFRRGYAKDVAKKCVYADLQSIAEAAGRAFGFSHPLWETSTASDLDLSSVSAERGKGNTVYWLVNSCAPAFRRMCESGVISNPKEFLERYFLGEE